LPNQLLILKYESYFDKVLNPADCVLYWKSNQISRKSIITFQRSGKSSGFIKQLSKETFRKKIQQRKRSKREQVFDGGKEILLGTNKYPNKNDKMKHDLELYPCKQKSEKRR
jgi:methylmalonyl-CoA mutase